MGVISYWVKASHNVAQGGLRLTMPNDSIGIIARRRKRYSRYGAERVRRSRLGYVYRWYLLWLSGSRSARCTRSRGRSWWDGTGWYAVYARYAVVIRGT